MSAPRLPADPRAEPRTSRLPQLARTLAVMSMDDRTEHPATMSTHCRGPTARVTTWSPRMASAAAPPPIAGTPIDPPPPEIPGFAEKLDRTAVGGTGYRALRRYSHANVALLTSGTAY